MYRKLQTERESLGWQSGERTGKHLSSISHASAHTESDTDAPDSAATV